MDMYAEAASQSQFSSAPMPQCLGSTTLANLKSAERRCRLLADAQFANDFPVAISIVGFQVVQKTAAIAHHHQQATTRCVIFIMGLEVFSQLRNAFAQNRDLHFGASGVACMGSEALNYVGFFCRCQHSVATPSLLSITLHKCLLKNNMLWSCPDIQRCRTVILRRQLKLWR